MGDGMNAAQLDRFNRFFDNHYSGILAEVALARQQRAVARVVIGTSALVAIGAEVFVAHR